MNTPDLGQAILSNLYVVLTRKDIQDILAASTLTAVLEAASADRSNQNSKVNCLTI